MADLAPTERPMHLGFGFHPKEEVLVGHYLHHKLLGDDDSIDSTIPEIGLCKDEPWNLLDRASSAASATKFEDFECYFFSPRDCKSSKSNRLNRSTSRGFWKVTGRDRKIIARDTNNVIGIKKILVYHMGRVSHGHRTNWVIHEYHDALLPRDQRTHVLCWLRKNNEKKIKEKAHQLGEGEEALEDFRTLEYGNQANLSINSKENLIDQTPPQSNEVTSLMTQTPLQSNEVTSLMIQTPPQSNEYIGLMSQTPPQSNEVRGLMTQQLLQSNEAIGLPIQPPLQSNEGTYSVIRTPSQQEEVIDAASHAQPPEPNYAVVALFEAVESEFSPFELSPLWQLSPSMDEQRFFETMATSENDEAYKTFDA